MHYNCTGGRDKVTYTTTFVFLKGKESGINNLVKMTYRITKSNRDMRAPKLMKIIPLAHWEPLKL
jgi:hypothetical protein